MSSAQVLGLFDPVDHVDLQSCSQPILFLLKPATFIQARNSSMNQISDFPIPMGDYIVSPTTHATGNGRFRASIAVQRSQSKGAYCRIFNFDLEFVSREAARVYAITQGWVETCMPRPQTC